VGKLDMGGLGFVRAEPAGTGRPGHDPQDLLKLHLYEYLHQVRSSRRRKAECRRKCRNDVAAGVAGSGFQVDRRVLAHACTGTR
jgi:transposase